MTMPIHTTLAEQELLPAEHLMSAGYASAAHLVNCPEKHQVRLVSPVRGDHSHQAALAVRSSWAGWIGWVGRR
jgi:hypothetical protein